MTDLVAKLGALEWCVKLVMIDMVRHQADPAGIFRTAREHYETSTAKLIEDGEREGVDMSAVRRESDELSRILGDVIDYFEPGSKSEAKPTFGLILGGKADPGDAGPAA